MDADGQPWQRTVLLKHYDAEGMVFYTSMGSRKARQLEDNPRISLVFPGTPGPPGVRHRPGGEARHPGGDEVLPQPPQDSQIAAWVSQQSTRISARGVLECQVPRTQAEICQGEVPLPSFWGRFRVRIDTVRVPGRARHRLHDRFCYTERDGWRIERAWPLMNLCQALPAGRLCIGERG